MEDGIPLQTIKMVTKKVEIKSGLRSLFQKKLKRGLKAPIRNPNRNLLRKSGEGPSGPR